MKLISLTILLLSLFSCAFAQEARKVDEFSHYSPCGDFLARMQALLNEKESTSNSKIYVLYYEGKHEVFKNADTKIQNPRFGDALSRAKEVNLVLKKEWRIQSDEVVLIDGGYREFFTLELWIVPYNSQPPNPTPTLQKKDIKFRKGLPYRTRDLSKCYS